MKVYLDTIGCRLNQSEIEMIAGQFRAAGHTVTGNPSEADLVVVNTCAVTAEAASDSRQKIRQSVRAGAGSVIATGCWSTLDPGGAAALPGVVRVVANDDKEHLVRDFLNLPEEVFDREPLARQPLPGLHQRTRAFIKVQDGCDNFCTFCITKVARGASRSRTEAEVLHDIGAALQGGTQEIVLTGVQLGSWGRDFEQPLHLRHLVETILSKTSVPRLRLSSLEPGSWTKPFLICGRSPGFAAICICLCRLAQTQHCGAWRARRPL
jgi:threonylcarbamoyladenosine tRNA methylthiotransferase MtaB